MNLYRGNRPPSANITMDQVEKGAKRLFIVAGLLSLTVLLVSGAALALVKVVNYSKETQLKVDSVNNTLKANSRASNQRRGMLPPSTRRTVVVTNYIERPGAIPLSRFVELEYTYRKGVVYRSDQLQDFNQYLESRGLPLPELPEPQTNRPYRPRTHEQKLKQLMKEGKIDYYIGD